jgi:hypothetical protein
MVLRYVSGDSEKASRRSRPSFPMMGNLGLYETSKPVPQIRTSSLCATPSSVMIPSSVISVIPENVTSHFSLVIASRYPLPGVGLYLFHLVSVESKRKTI